MLRDVFRACRDQLAQGDIEAPDFEALCLLEHATGFNRAGLIAHGDEPVPEAQQALLHSLTEKRLTRYPLQYLLGEWSFMGIPLSVGEGVLIPRDDTEVCAGLCLDYLRNKPHARALDLCAGSGAIALALEQLGKADVTAVELSDKAFYFLRKNIGRNRSDVTAYLGDVLCCHSDFPDGSFDLIVSNPPYIKRGELPDLQAEVQHEPRMALDGGESGFDFYEAIVRGLELEDLALRPFGVAGQYLTQSEKALVLLARFLLPETDAPFITNGTEVFYLLSAGKKGSGRFFVSYIL